MNYQLIAVNVTKQALHADPRAIQQIVFEGVAGVKLRLCEKWKEVFEFYKGTVKVL